MSLSTNPLNNLQTLAYSPVYLQLNKQDPLTARKPPRCSGYVFGASGRTKINLKSGPENDAADSFSESPSTSRRFVDDAWNVCLVGENRACSVPAFWVY